MFNSQFLAMTGMCPKHLLLLFGMGFHFNKCTYKFGEHMSTLGSQLHDPRFYFLLVGVQFSGRIQGGFRNDAWGGRAPGFDDNKKTIDTVMQ